jgi:hypothetical protein
LQRVPTYLFTICLLLLGSWAGFAFDQGSPAPPEVVEVRIQRIALARIDSGSADFELQLSGTAKKSVTLKSIFFQEVSVEGVPLRVAPITGPIKLVEGQEISNLPVLTATVAFRQMPSLRPLRDIMRNGTSHIHAIMLVQLALNPLQMFALRTSNAWAVTTLDEETKIDVPGGVITRTAALAALSAAEPIWVLGNAGQEWRLANSTFASQAQVALAGSTVSIGCSYQIRGRQGETELLRTESIGSILPSGRILTTAEAIEPWAFDLAVAEALGKHEITIVPDSVEVVVRQPGDTHEYSSGHAEVRILYVKGGSRSLVSSRKHRSYHLRFRDVDDNVALLELVDSHAARGSFKKAGIDEDSDWRPAAVLRGQLETDGPKVWITEIKKENGRWILRDPAGVTAFGSPVWTDEGFVGLLQSDSSAAPLGNVSKSFPSELF